MIRAYSSRFTFAAGSLGADDLDGTIIEEKITHMAGAMTGEGMTREDLIYLIRKAGKTAVERDGLYNEIWKE